MTAYKILKQKKQKKIIELNRNHSSYPIGDDIVLRCGYGYDVVWKTIGVYCGSGKQSGRSSINDRSQRDRLNHNNHIRMR